jgi:hypothetical protein
LILILERQALKDLWNHEKMSEVLYTLELERGVGGEGKISRLCKSELVLYYFFRILCDGCDQNWIDILAFVSLNKLIQKLKKYSNPAFSSIQVSKIILSQALTASSRDSVRQNTS